MLPCLVCSRVSGGATVIEAAHTNALGSRRVGQKTSDFSAIPLCSWHHRAGQDSYHRLGERWFAQAHQIHLLEVVQTLNRRNGRQIPWPIRFYLLSLLIPSGRAARNHASRYSQRLQDCGAAVMGCMAICRSQLPSGSRSWRRE
jgi:hypothetical protein